MSKYSIQTAIPASVFRAYDIRGIVDQEISLNAVYTIALALGAEARSLGETSVVIARDGRVSGVAWLTALQQGLSDSGIDVINIGDVPSPTLFFATHQLPTCSGIMVTGSHNPAEYNGLKIVLAGEVVFGDRILALYDRIQRQDFCTGQGVVQEKDIVADYVDNIVKDIVLKKQLKIVIDAGNGIAGKIAPMLFERLGCDVNAIFCEVDGTFPNHHPDPSQAENLSQLIDVVKSNKADIGLAFDGDGDRLGVITNTGQIIWPDRQLMLLAVHVVKEQPGATVVYDVKCSKHLEAVIRQHGGKPVMWKTGHSYIKQKMKELDAAVGGEMSGHLFFRDRYLGFDDALYAGARMLEILSNTDQSSSEVFSALPDSVNTPELKMSLGDEQKFTFIDSLLQSAKFEGASLNKVDGLRADFPYGWGLVRPSNTTPCIVFRFEADDAESLTQVQDAFRAELLAIDQHLTLPF